LKNFLRAIARINDLTSVIIDYYWLLLLLLTRLGDILGPLLFIFYLAAVLMTWRSTYQRPLCVFHTKMDDLLTGRKYNTKSREEFTLPDS